MTSKEHLARAIALCGGQSKLSRAIKTSQARVWYWLHEAAVVPGEACLKIEAATGGAVTRQQLRPDLWGPAC